MLTKDQRLVMGEKIRQQRIKAGKTQEELCNQEGDLSVRQIRRWENGQSEPCYHKAFHLAKLLGCPMESFMPTCYYFLACTVCCCYYLAQTNIL